jgi:HSP20 family protein
MEKGKELARTEPMRRPGSFWDMDKWFDESLLRPFAPLGLPRLMRAAAAEEVMPAMDIFEDNGNIVLKAELPGINKDDIDITLADGAITISGEKKKEEEVKQKDYYKWERSYGSFCRTFALPTEVQAEKITSTFKNGILEVKLPKSEAAKSKEVKVKIQ